MGASAVLKNLADRSFWVFLPFCSDADHQYKKADRKADECFSNHRMVNEFLHPGCGQENKADTQGDKNGTKYGWGAICA